MNDEIFNEIKDKFNAFIEEDRTLKYLLVNAENLQGAAEFLKERGYEHLSFVTAIDRQNELEAVYLLSSYVEGNYNSVALKVKSNSSDAGGATGTKTEISDENFIVPTLTEIFNSADWHERETYDMFGIKFNGHKNLKRILLPTQFIGHPLRKSYPLGKEQEISLYGDFEATKDELTVDKFLKDEDKINMFVLGAKAATQFLIDFDWEEYKKGRSQMQVKLAEENVPETTTIKTPNT